MLDLERECFQAIVFKLNSTSKHDVQKEIEILKIHFGDDTDFLEDRRGAHWAKARNERFYLFNKRGSQHTEASFNEILDFLKIKPKALQMALSKGGGRTSFLRDEEVYEIINPRLKKSIPKNLHTLKDRIDAEDKADGSQESY